MLAIGMIGTAKVIILPCCLRLAPAGLLFLSFSPKRHALRSKMPLTCTAEQVSVQCVNLLLLAQKDAKQKTKKAEKEEQKTKKANARFAHASEQPATLAPANHSSIGMYTLSLSLSMFIAPGSLTPCFFSCAQSNAIMSS